MMGAAVSAVLALIEQLLPLLGGANASLIEAVITALEKVVPLIIDWAPTVYQSVKNAITALSANPDTIPDQLSRLQTLDKQVDDAFDAVAKDVDPDAAP
jgi:hypothetical protein